MSNDPKDPPIGTAQNAADAARKAEALQAILNDSAKSLEMRTAAFAVLKANEALVQAREARASAPPEAVVPGQVVLPWKDETIERAYWMLNRNVITSEAPSMEAFRFALTYLVFGD